MEKFDDIFSYTAMIILFLMTLIPLIGLLRDSVKQEREIDEAIRKRKADALQKEKEISAFIKAS